MNPALDSQAPVLATHGGHSYDASDADAAVVRAQDSYDLGALGSPDDTSRRAQAVLG
jgi:hypothetical protein